MKNTYASKLVCVVPLGYEAKFVGGIPCAFSPHLPALYFNEDKGEWVNALSGLTLSEHEEEKALLLGPG